MKIKKLGRKIRERKKIELVYRVFPEPGELDSNHSINEILDDLVREEGGIIDSINLLQNDFLAEGKKYDLISIQLNFSAKDGEHRTYLFLGRFNEGGV